MWHVACINALQRAPSSACIGAVSPQYIIVHPAAGCALPSSVKHRQSSLGIKTRHLHAKNNK
jgi:hypothetical protein